MPLSSTPTTTASVAQAAPPRDDDIPLSPPAEVLAAIDEAARAYERLAATGRRLHFIPRPSGGVAIALVDARTGVHRLISAGDALRYACDLP